MDQTMTSIREKFDALLGLKVWDAKLGIGSFLTMEFGEGLPPETTRHGRVLPPRGEWHLWIQHCAWRLEQGSKVLTASNDDRDKIKQVVPLLDGHTLVDIQLHPPAWDTLFQFSGNHTLRTFAYEVEECEQWQLFVPDGNVLTIGPVNQWSYVSGDLPRDEGSSYFYVPEESEQTEDK